MPENNGYTFTKLDYNFKLHFNLPFYAFDSPYLNVNEIKYFFKNIIAQYKYFYTILFVNFRV